MGEALKPCPFCGRPGEYEQVTGFVAGEPRWSVGCNDDECLGYISIATYGTQREATAAWNRRTPPDGQQGE